MSARQLGAIILAGVGWWYWRAQQAQQAARAYPSTGSAGSGATRPAGDNAATPADDYNGPGEAVSNLPRGIRNNNPGNLRASGDLWLGLASPSQDEQGYLIFTQPYYGLRAMAITLRNYQDRHGLRTIRSIIGRYAPTSENDTAAYVAAVSRAMNIGADFVLNLHNTDALDALVAAMVQHENGMQPYSAAQIDSAVKAWSFG